MEGMLGMAKYKKATAPLDETARGRLWATSPLFNGEETSTPELADLVDSFYEGGRGDERDWSIGFGSGGRDCEGVLLDAILSDSGADLVAERVRVHVEDAVRAVGSGGDELKRRVMGRLRNKGYDAGLCKSQWDHQTSQTSRMPTGHHDYIDAVANSGTRYIVEINLASEFEIARPTDEYIALLRAIPKVLISNPEVLRGLINIMCVAAKESIKSAGMHIPPWRTREYMQEKWFSSYKRVVTTLEPRGGGAARSSEARPATVSSSISNPKVCRMEMASLEGARGRKLAVSFRG